MPAKRRKLDFKSYAAFDLETGEKLQALFRTQAATFRELIKVLQSVIPQLDVNSTLRVIFATRLLRLRRTGVECRWVNQLGQIAVSVPARAGERDILLGSFLTGPSRPCARCGGGGIELSSIGKPQPDSTGFLAGVDEELTRSVEAALTRAPFAPLKGAYQALETFSSATSHSYQFDFRSEYLSRDPKSRRYLPRRITVLKKLGVAVPGFPSPKSLRVGFSSEPVGEPGDPCNTCGGSGFKTIERDK